MRLKSSSSLWELTASYLKKWGWRRASASLIYQVLEIKKSPAGYYRLAVQAAGQNQVFHSSPQDLIANDRILEGLSKKDIRNLAYMACEQSKIPHYRIVMQEFCNKLNRILFRLKRHDSNEYLIKTAGQISLDKQLINNLSQEDVCSISYVAGYEQSYLEGDGNRTRQ